MMQNEQERLVWEKLSKLRHKYEQSLPHKLARIERIWRRLVPVLSKREGSESFNELLLEVHSIAGSSGSFGFGVLGEHAAEIEKKLSWLAGSKEVGVSLQKHIREIDRQIRDLLNYKELEPISQSENKLLEHDLPIKSQVKNDNLIYCFDDAGTLETQYRIWLETFDWKCSFFKSAAVLLQAIGDRCPSVLIFKSDLHQTPVMDLMEKIHAECEIQIPCLYLTNEWNCQTRLQAVKKGVTRFVPEPLTGLALIDELEQLHVRTETKPYRILVVEDSIILAKHFQTVLQQIGMRVKIVNQVTEILKTLEEFQPELILMDIYMPECNGVEVASVIRQDRRYLSIPIIYLSTELRQEEQFKALSMGDGFLIKPIHDHVLQFNVKNRVERFRHLHELIQVDANTHALTSPAFHQSAQAKLFQLKESGRYAQIARLSPICETESLDSGVETALQFLARFIAHEYPDSLIHRKESDLSLLVFMPCCDKGPQTDWLLLLREKLERLMLEISNSQASCGLNFDVLDVDPGGSIDIALSQLNAK